MHRRQLPQEEVGGKRLGRAEAVKQLLPMALSFVLGGMWTVGHGCHVFGDHPFGVLWALGSVHTARVYMCAYMGDCACPSISTTHLSSPQHTPDSITMAYLSTRMIVCHMAKQPFGHAELLLPVLPQLLVVLNTYGGASLSR